jgi:hypothetical protein
MSTTTTPEIVTTDVATYTAGRAIAIVQRHDFADGEVRHDMWTNRGDFDPESCDDPDAAVDYGTVTTQAGHKLRELRQRDDRGARQR